MAEAVLGPRFPAYTYSYFIAEGNVSSPVVSENGRRDWRAVILSSHFDDAALSLGGIIQRLSGPVAIVTVHGGPPTEGLPISFWDSDCGFVSPMEAFTVRKDEDARACSLLGAEQVLLPHADNPYLGRGELTSLDVFLATVPPIADIYVPLGTAQPDHARVRDRALQVLSRTMRPEIRVYADLPYSAVVPSWGAGSTGTALASATVAGAAYRQIRDQYGLEVMSEVCLDENEWRRKRNAIFCYASQLGPVANIGDPKDGAFLRYPGPLQFEMIWTLRLHPEPRQASILNRSGFLRSGY